VQYTRSRANTLFGLNCGAGLDEGKYAFQYAKHTAAKTTHGCGIVIDGVEAFFIPMEVK
jgi:hypothetical protein